MFIWNRTAEAPKALLFSNLKITVSYFDGIELVIVLLGPVYVDPLYSFPVVLLKADVFVLPHLEYWVCDYIYLNFLIMFKFL